MSELVSVILAKASAARAPWAEGLEITLPPELAAALGGNALDAILAQVPLDRVRLNAAFTNTPPTSSRLPFSYQNVPLVVRTLIGGAIGRAMRRRQKTWGAFPRFPIDLSADFLADLRGERSLFASGPTPVLLSHDLDTADGLANAVKLFLPIEEAVGARSASYIVPCGWPIDHGLLGELSGRGHEVGIHGYDHSNRTPFADPDKRKERLDAALPLISRYGITGYRAPSLVRTRPLLEDLTRLYRYDSSIPTSGGLFPVPNNGCASARPFKLCGIVELPLSMPRDGSLRFLGYGADEIFQIWCDCADLIARSGGVVSLLTHCEERFSGNRNMLAGYERFLRFLAESGRFQFATTGDVLARIGGEAR